MRTLLRCLTVSRATLTGLCLLVALALTGCTLYFGPDDSDSDGRCNGDPWSCGPGGPPHSSCDADYECAAGCYCTDSKAYDGIDGVCVESGYCRDASDCGSGMSCDDGTCKPADRGCKADKECPVGSTCDEPHRTCVPNDCGGACPAGTACDVETNACVPTTCTSDAECPKGAYCDEPTGQCKPSTGCSDDSQCPGGYCDEGRKTCVPGTDPNAATCGREVTCNLTAKCPLNQVPLVNADGCFSNPPVCVPYEQCGASPPPCEVLNTAKACDAFATSCVQQTVGTDCHVGGPTGPSCREGDVNCVCSRSTFSRCADKP